jgi:hypothetical protein
VPLNGEDNSPISHSQRPDYHWPAPLGKSAWYGLAGEIVEVVSPHSEGDPAALLVQLLVCFGNMVGHKPMFEVESDRHRMNLFCALVGETSKSRKGTSWGRVERIATEVEPEWIQRVLSGLVSGEGLIWQVRDRDRDEHDHRLLVVESELASVLKVIKRKENTLSAIVRQAWDSGTLNTLSKNCPAKATEAHISIVGHITREELQRELTTTEVGNGFANRFLWVCVKRSRVLPEGGSLKLTDLTPLIERFKAALGFGKGVGQLCREGETRELWAQEYPRLSEGCPGLFGAVTSRAEAQVTRLSCLYALLDKSEIVHKQHLQGALEIWRYAEDSARFIFREVTGLRTEDRLLESLREHPDGLTRTQISGLFSRHVNGSQLDQLLSYMRGRGFIDMRTESTTGRPTERWCIVRTAK